MPDFTDENPSGLVATLNETPTSARAVSPTAHRETIVSIAREVISKLSERLVTDIDRVQRPSTEQLDQFCNALIGSDEGKAAGQIDELLSQGASFNTVYLGYIAAAAIRLGQRWEDDTSTFVEMTVASGRMYSIMRNLRRNIPPAQPNNPKHAIFSAIPGEKHILGVTMAADLFRRRGWDIDVEFGQTRAELVDLVCKSNHRFIGLSASGPERSADLAKLIVDLRICKPHAFIMVSGNITDKVGQTIKNLIDADYITHDAPSAILEMEQVWQAWERNG